MQSEFNKQKQELEKYKKIQSTLNMTKVRIHYFFCLTTSSRCFSFNIASFYYVMKRKYEKEKEDLSKLNQSLSKQLDEAKEGNYFFLIRLDKFMLVSAHVFYCCQKLEREQQQILRWSRPLRRERKKNTEFRY